MIVDINSITVTVGYTKYITHIFFNILIHVVCFCIQHDRDFLQLMIDAHQEQEEREQSGEKGEKHGRNYVNVSTNQSTRN